MPALLVLIVSFSDEKSVLTIGYSYFPQAWSLQSYAYLFNQGAYIGKAFLNSIFVTVTGTCLGLVMCSTMGYALSRPNYRLRKFFSYFILIPMLFSGGLVASYMINVNILGLKNTYWALILPICCSSFYVVIMRTFFQTSVPEAIIESAKIPLVSELVEQAQKAVAEGGKEIVITGVNIGDFGKSTGESFISLVKALDGVEGVSRYRISSIEPNLITDEIIEYVAQSRSFMPHFHIPLQAGSDEVLKLMHRRYDTAFFARKIARVREVLPDAFIGVDVIVGTRGESEELFERAYEFIKGLDISQLHVFSYSERPGTQALKIEGAVFKA